MRLMYVASIVRIIDTIVIQELFDKLSCMIVSCRINHNTVLRKRKLPPESTVVQCLITGIESGYNPRKCTAAKILKLG